jgi:hypothetical protein
VRPYFDLDRHLSLGVKVRWMTLREFNMSSTSTFPHSTDKDDQLSHPYIIDVRATGA